MALESDHRIKLPVFEGPLDLLLFLVRKNELDIYDIPIESVTRQYIDALRQMRELNLEVAGEFFVMAASLMEIKSRMLLPKEQRAMGPLEDEDDIGDPRWDLVHQLLQYRKFKDAASDLAAMASRRQNMLERLAPARRQDELERPLQGVDHIELWAAFNLVLRRLAEKLVVGEIHDEVVTVADQMEWLLQRLTRQGSFLFTELFPDGTSLRRLVATFLAVLELTRLGKLAISQDAAFSDIQCRPAGNNPLEPAPETVTVPA